MFLKEIKVQGFKSFADKINLELNNGITGIVGPNGSGKSNVVDAIRWVLGEQSIKSLRGENSMTDVIFSGSKSRSGVNIASVELIFDNSDRYIQVDVNQISIKRKVYKDGTNEYFLNNQPSRFKDITDILLDTGIAKESFNIISQGKIDEIISTKPTDRRIIFEEAAGVLKYKKRKNEALKKLEKTHENMIRIDDILSEVNSQLEPLKEEREKALLYEEYNSELKDLEISLVAYDIKNLNDHYQITKKQTDKLNDEIILITTSSSNDESIILKDKKEIDELSKKVEENQKKLLELTKKVEQVNSEKKIILERKKYEVQDQALHNNLINLKESLLINENNISTENNIISNLNNELAKIKNDSLSLNNDLKLLIAERNKLDITLMNEIREREIIQNKIERIKDSIENNLTLPSAVSSVLNNPKLDGIHNILGNLIEVDSQYTLAISTSLGASVNNIIVDNEVSAKAAINYLKTNNNGRATFFPLNIIKPRGIDPEALEILKNISGFINTADNLVKFQPTYYNIIKNQLGNVLVVKDIDTANIVAKKLNYRYKIVTLDGEILHIGGSLTGGKIKQSNIMNEKLNLENNLQLHKESIIRITELENKINDNSYKFKSIEDKIYLINKEEIKTETEISTRSAYINKLNETILNIQNEIKGVSSLINNSISVEEESILNKYYEVLKEKEETEFNLTNLIKIKDELISKIEEKEYVYKKQNSDFIEKNNALKALEIDLNRADVKLDNLLNFLSEQYNITYEYAINNYVLKIDEKVARNTINTLKTKIKELGFVNLNAPNMYEEVKNRHEFLSNQKIDLTNAESTLLEIIEEMDLVMQREFVTTFNLIQDNFKRIFSELFKGGTAYLKFTDPSNILETGIEIIAEPPGKKLTSISLLSGGEKTFTAISLLFAILNSRPVPFCVFDEVEAALDEVNVEAFGNYLIKLKEKTQFIIITHKKKTMEFVDLLYGITMQESGVSKLVSVKLEELK